jgi:beta-galactosidase/beta-glucuronidase
MTPEMLDACDSLGILVIEENRLTGVNEEHTRLLKLGQKTMPSEKTQETKN